MVRKHSPIYPFRQPYQPRSVRVLDLSHKHLLTAEQVAWLYRQQEQAGWMLVTSPEGAEQIGACGTPIKLWTTQPKEHTMNLFFYIFLLSSLVGLPMLLVGKWQHRRGEGA